MEHKKALTQFLKQKHKLSKALNNERLELRAGLEGGAMSTTDFLRDSMVNIHKSYCLSNGLPYDQK